MKSRGRKHSRKSQKRPARKRVFIFCEGQETEYNYIHKLKIEDEIKLKSTVRVQKGKGGSRHQIVQDAVKKKTRFENDFDEFWCVMDVERLQSQEHREDLNKAIQIANDHKISLFLSNPTFEVWLLSHFIRSSQNFNDCDAVIIELNKQWQNAFNLDYSKNDNNIFHRLKSRFDFTCDSSDAK